MTKTHIKTLTFVSGSIIKIRLYGESFYIHTLKPENQYLEKFQQVAKKLKEPIEEAILNISFFKILNMEGYDTLESFIDFRFGGLLNNSKCKIEIWQGRKCLQKLNLNDLFFPPTLFPLFNTIRENITIELKRGIFLIEKEVGLIGEYVIECNDFDISLLQFTIYDIEYLKDCFQLLAALSYNSKILESQKSDTLLIHRHCVNNLYIK